MPADDSKMRLQSPITRTKVALRVWLRNGTWYDLISPYSSAFDAGEKSMTRDIAGTLLFRQGLGLIKELQGEYLSGGMYVNNGELCDVQSEVRQIRFTGYCYMANGVRRRAFAATKISAITYTEERVIIAAQACVQRVADSLTGGNYNNSDAPRESTETN